MQVDIKVPVLPESVKDAIIATWFKNPGDAVKRDEHLVDIETDKVVLEVVAPEDGVLESILQQQGDTVTTQQVIGLFKIGAVAIPAKVGQAPIVELKTATAQKSAVASPSVRRLMSENHLSEAAVEPTGKNARIQKEDVLKVLEPKKVPSLAASPSVLSAERLEKRVPMTRLRARIAERMVQAKQTAAILTTFNEVNMQPVMDLRARYKDSFEKKYGVRLGFMSFFAKAAVAALKRFPLVNASIDGQDIVYHGYTDMGIAVSSDRGLVVPVLRNVDTLSMAEIEKQISDYSKKAQEGRMSIEDMNGGTFTISNGGVFGSLLSTPIINPPQTAILGMHKIQERVMVVAGEMKICPMMYLALSYDHRLIDGSESVRFLLTIKECLEDPARLLLEI